MKVADDYAVDVFIEQMTVRSNYAQDKLSQSRITFRVDSLWTSLRHHAGVLDAVGVACDAMMIWDRKRLLPLGIGVAAFQAAMTAKLDDARGKGRFGWQGVELDQLWLMLWEHVEKGDPIDVANFAMMIWHVDRRTELRHG